MVLSNIAPHGQISLAFQQLRMIALEELTSDGSVQVESVTDVNDMTTLMSLTQVTFDDMRHCHTDTVCKMPVGLLGHKLGSTRPDVQSSML